MANLLWCTIPTSIIYFGVFVVILVLIIKHSKKNLLIALILLVLLIIAVPTLIPFYKDISQQEVETIEGTYTQYSRHIGLVPCSENAFENNSGRIYVYISDFQYSKCNLHERNRYKITCYKNSYAVHSIEMIL